MNVNFLPNEILQVVLKNLNGKDLLACRRVSDRWQHLVDTLGEAFWMKIVAKDHKDIFKEAYRKARLSWFELYMSIALWSDVSSADVKVYQIPTSKTNIFTILKDGIIACPQKKISSQNEWYNFDMIVRYDLATLEETSKQDVDFTFTFNNYAENDNFIVLKLNQEFRRIMFVVAKRIDKHMTIEEQAFISSVLLENEIYYQVQNKFCRVKLDGNNIIVENLDNVHDEKQLPPKWLVDIAKPNNETNILTWSDTVLSLKDKKLKLIGHIRHFDSKLEELKKYGFKWGFPDIHDHLETKRFTKFYLDTKTVTAGCVYGKIAVIGTSKPRYLHIFYNPFNHRGELDIHNAEPVKSIDLEPYKLDSEFKRHTHLVQIDVVEIPNGHKLIVLYCYKIFVVELTHNFT